MAEFTSTGTIDMSVALVGFDPAPGGPEATGTDVLEWDLDHPSPVIPEVTVLLGGSGFAYDPGTPGLPVAGTATSMRIVLDRFSFSSPDALLTGFALPLTEVLPGGTDGRFDAIGLFERVLPGDDLLSLGDGSLGFGDALDLSGGTHVFGADSLTLTGTDGTLYGDARVLRDGATGQGGADVLEATGAADLALRLTGDAMALIGATMQGGDDRVLVSAGVGGTGFVQTQIVGDVQEVIGASDLTGGNDTLIGAWALGDRIFGDAELLQGADARLTGGDDRLEGRGGDDLLFGDVDQISSGRLIAGDDTLIGNAGNDTMWGDVGRLGGGVLESGGNDRLVGGGGDDAALGQAGNDTLKGGSGNDTLLGEAGRDRIAGGSGDDLISGGTDADRMKGGAGADTFLYRSAEESGAGGRYDMIAGFDPGIDVIDLSDLAAASVTGSLVWVGADYAREAGTVGYADKGAKLKLMASLDADGGPDATIWVKGAEALGEADLLL